MDGEIIKSIDVCRYEWMNGWIEDACFKNVESFFSVSKLSAIKIVCLRPITAVLNFEKFY